MVPMGMVAATSTAAAHPGHGDETFKALVFSKTAGFRHDSIEAGIAAIEQLGVDNGFEVDATEDAGAFTDDNLAQYEVVIWLSTTGDVLNDDQQGAFERYVNGGGGYAGIHAASDTEYDWQWYGDLVGAYFESHPAQQDATVLINDQVHPSTAGLPTSWQRFDEWYNYRANPRGNVHVLATLDEDSYDPGGGAMGEDHPIAWCQNYDGGRSWYTGMGHTIESFSEAAYLDHILGGIQTAAGVVDADCGATVDANFQQVTLAQGESIGEPMGMTVLPGGGVLHTARDGRVFHTTAEGDTNLAATVPIYSHDEDGLQTIAADPNFAENGWVYLYYAPPLDTPPGDAPEDGTGPETFEPFEGHNQLSRFTFANGQLDLDSEQVILTVPADRGICCHAGGDISFDADGNLLLSTGDDSNPFASDGYTPIDERSTRNPSYDAQRSASNTNDLRGKLLRVSVNADGSYGIPDGNLFAEGTENTRPEIYAMGFRNPFRFDVDQQTGTVWLGDYGPDAGSAKPDRGPGGQVEFNRITEAANFGWPYCTGDNDAYIDYDFATGTSGSAYDCAAPVNDSPRNTGLGSLPPSVPAWLPYDDCSVPEFGCGSESPMGGPVYRYDDALESDVKFPAYFDGTLFLYEWGRGWIKNVVLDENQDRVAINPFLDGIELTRPMDLQFGPNGALYVLDYGSGYFGGSPESAVYRIEYTQGERAPTARIAADPTNGQAPLTVSFDGAESSDPDPGDIITTYEWDFDDDGTTDSTDVTPIHTFTENGVFNARLTVTDNTGEVGTATVPITVGNTAPEVEINGPEDGMFFSFGDAIEFDLTVTDPDGTEVNCDDVIVDYILGHDEHGHPLAQANGCEGTIVTSADSGHGDDTNVFGVLNARFTDGGGPGDIPPLTGEDEIVLQPKHRQAEHFQLSGVQVVDDAGAEGGKRVGYVDNGDWISLDPVNFAGTDAMVIRAASGGSGGTIEVRLDDPAGELVGSVDVPNTGGYGNFVDLPPVTLDTAAAGAHRLYLAFTGGDGGLFDVDSIAVQGRGASSNLPPVIDEASATPSSGEIPLDVDFSGSATDPDGEDVTYEWDFDGDGTADADGGSAANTYTASGTHNATFTATDTSGLSASTNLPVHAYAPATCLTPGSDQFDGTSLDRDRWPTIVREDATGYRVADGRLEIDAVDGDMYGENTTAKNLVLQPAPDGVWSATTKFTLPTDADDDYEQAGVLVYGDDADFAKAVLIQLPDGSLQFEFALNVNGSADFDGTLDRSGPLPDDFPDEAFLRVVSSGDTLRAFYSADGVNWTQFGRDRSLAGLSDPQVGLAAYHGVGQTATFDWFRLAPSTDEFDGDTLDTCRWNGIVRDDPSGYRLTGDGRLEIDTSDGDIYGGNVSQPKNFILQQAPPGDWTMETKVDISAADERYQQGGLIAYADDGTYVKLDVVTNNVAGNDVTRRVELRSEIGDTVQQPQPGFADPESDVIWFRLTKSGTSYTGYYSYDGETWTAVGDPVQNDALGAEMKLGVFALGHEQQASKPVLFDYVRVGADSGGEPACDTPTPPDEGYTALFDGTADSLAGWSQAGPGSFSLTSDCELLSQGGLGLYWYQAQSFNDYRLELDWMMPGDDNSGVFVGFPDPGDDPWVAVNEGHEVQIDATDSPDRTTGAIYAFQSADIEARDAALNPPGEWNTFEIVVTGDRIEVFLNDVKINDYTDTDPARMNQPSYVGIQNHGSGDQVYFRDVQIKEIADMTAPTVDLAVSPSEPDGQNGWWTRAVTVTATATDDVSSGDDLTVEYRDGDGEWTPYTGAFVFDSDGSHTLQARATDAAGNTSEPVSAEVMKDGVAPVTTASPVDGEWSSGAVDVTLEAADETSGVESTEWALDGGEWSAYEGPVTVEGDGEHSLLYRSTDTAGNVEDVKAVTLAIDGSAPVLVVSGVAHGEIYGDSQDLAVTWEAADDTSGVVSVSGSLDDDALESGDQLVLHELTLGIHSLTVTAEDAAGNGTTQEITFFVDTSFDDIENLITRFSEADRLDADTASDLHKLLSKARKAEAKGKDEKAVEQLEAFEDVVSDGVSDQGVRDVLLRDANSVME